MKYYFLIIVCVALNVGANLLLKTGSRLEASPVLFHILSWRSFFGLLVFGLSALFYIQALKLGSLSLTQSMIAVQYVGVLVAAHFLLGESLTLLQIGGCALVGAGILLVVNGG